MIGYKEENIGKCLELLNNIEIKGIENATRIAMIATVLQNSEKGEDNGNIHQEE